MTEPGDTLRVLGGRALGTADAGAVRTAAGHSGLAETRLRTAAYRATLAADRLTGLAWSPGALPAEGQPRSTWLGLAARARASALDLHAGAEECALLRDRLLRAAGLYEHGESLVSELVGVAVGGPATVAMGASLLLPASGLTSGLVRTAAPWTDEGTAFVGTTLGVPTSMFRKDGSAVADAAWKLSTLVRAFLPATSVEVREVRPTGTGRAWDATPSGTVPAALARIPQLTGIGMVAGDRAAGVPEATLAVQRVVHDGGWVTWTVLIPGTQDLVSSRHPFDGVSDLDLMAARAADLSEAIEEALAQAGARPEEEVVLFGHSLGGIVAMQLASGSFGEKHALGGVVTAGSPTASFAVPVGVPVLHLESDEELVSNLDGLSGDENPATPDRVTVTRRLADSADPLDVAAAGSVAAAHGLRTHLRTYALAGASDNVAVRDVVGRIEPLLRGTTTTRFYSARRVQRTPQEIAPSGAEPAGVSGASSGRRPR